MAKIRTKQKDLRWIDLLPKDIWEKYLSETEKDILLSLQKNVFYNVRYTAVAYDEEGRKLPF